MDQINMDLTQMTDEKQLESFKQRLSGAPETAQIMTALKSDPEKLSLLKQQLLEGDTKGAAAVLETLLSAAGAQAAFFSLSEKLK